MQKNLTQRMKKVSFCLYACWCSEITKVANFRIKVEALNLATHCFPYVRGCWLIMNQNTI